MKNILIINANPNSNSLSFEIEREYIKGAQTYCSSIETLHLNELQFDLNLSGGFKSTQSLEPDLIMAQEKIQNADHIVWIFPIWWGSFPALLKGFIDRTFLPGFAFKYRENSPMWDKLLIGKTSEIICTMDSPTLYYKYLLGESGVKVFRKSILDFCGIKVVKTTYFSMVRKVNDEKIKTWLNQANAIGFKRAKSLI